jgi:hypothetical protein
LSSALLVLILEINMKFGQTSFKTVDLDGMALIAPTEPTAIITAWNAVWTLWSGVYPDPAVRTMLVYHNNKITTAVSDATKPGAEIILPIKIKIVKATIKRSVGTHSRNNIYWGLIRMDDCMYLIPDYADGGPSISNASGPATVVCDKAILPLMYGRFNFETWVRQSKDAVDVTDCKRYEITNILSQEAYEKLYKKFTQHVKGFK